MPQDAESPKLQATAEGHTSFGRFGTFDGVFTPTILTILGVIMYLREGWVVGNAGLLGAWLIISLGCAITACTALSLSSIASNVRMGAGGPYAIVSRSLGLELGGSIGLPLYLSQALAVTMYIFGFREGWNWLFPEHPPLLVDTAIFAFLFAIAFISTELAFRIQYLILAIIAASLVSIFGSLIDTPFTHEATWWGEYPGSPENGFRGTGFWAVFAVFFPATTGIMAGANMSGELKNPRRNIPFGTLSAVAVCTVIYLALAYWLARVASPEELVSNYTIMIDKSLWAPIVIAGLLGATFSSALSSLVGAPRILQALAQNRIVPGAEKLGARNAKGEPRNAMVVTGVIVLLGLLMRDLNVVAPLITMFFLITYGMINIIVLLEQRLEVVSFRPLLRIPQIIPLLGTVGCLFAMFIVNPALSLVAVVMIVFVYQALSRRKLDSETGDMRSGAFVAIAEWAARRTANLPDSQSRAWKANLLIPVTETSQALGHFDLILDIASPHGSVKFLGVTSNPSDKAALEDDVSMLANDFRERDVFASSSVLVAAPFGRAVVMAMEVLRSAFFRPNILYLPLREDQLDAGLEQAILAARENQMGVLVSAMHPDAGMGRHTTLNIWLREQTPNWEVELSLSRGNLNLLILISYILSESWEGKLRLLTAVDDPDQSEEAERYIRELAELARIPKTAEISVRVGDFKSLVEHAPIADVHLFGLPSKNFNTFISKMLKATHGTCLFVRDSGEESALV